MADIPGNESTTATLTLGSSVDGTLEVVGDHDWYKIDLTAGQQVTILLTGVTLEDPYLRIRDAAGNVLFESDDINPGIERDSKVSFVVPQSGTYYIDAGAWDENYAGTYNLSVQNYTPPPVWSIDEVANYLTSGFWGGESRHFDVTQGDTITVNLSALTAAGKTLAQRALATWSDIIGVSFTVVTTGGQITFDDNEDGAFADSVYTGGFITSSHVNVSAQWLADYGSSTNSYSYQAYIHEIGHALGLGHAGPYNLTGDFFSQALFENDGWPTTVMSYFSQDESSYYNDRGFSYGFVLTPMIADVVAMQLLYGLSTTTRAGNTTYGFNSNAGNAIFDPSLTPSFAYTIIDSGGIDTLNYGSFSAPQLINLNAETFSNIGGRVGNVSIARGTVIENATGGSGNDKIIGNSANNVLMGGAGEDTLSYESATAGVTVNLGLTNIQNTVGAGSDTLNGFEILHGSGFADTLTGTVGTIHIYGGGGNDTLSAGGGGSGVTDIGLYGEEGDDLFIASAGNEWFGGGEGFDTVDYSLATGAITVSTGAANNFNASSGYDTMNMIERVIGSNYDDTLWAWNDGHVAMGGAGNDTLKASPWGASQLFGGIGNDTYIVDHALAVVTEYSGEGADLVVAGVTFVLPANVENLTLAYANAINGTGNGLNNIITGNSAANGLAGGVGNDTLQGGAGTDTFLFKSGDGQDVVTDLVAGETVEIRGHISAQSVTQSGGNVIVVFSASDRITFHGTTVATVQAALLFADKPAGPTEGDDILTGTDGDDLIHALGGNDKIYGLAGNDTLNGGTGADLMLGGAGNDSYYVDNAGDQASEAANSGTDWVYSSVDFVLWTDVENLTLTGTAISAGGNAGTNTLIGNAQNNVLNGGAGADMMIGGAGNDSYYVDNAGDRASEAANGGTDHVYSSISFTLWTDVENLTLTGAAITAIGNASDNMIIGNAQNNVLNGDGGADLMIGGAGNDSYYVDNAGDRASEGVNGGTDWVYSSVSFTLWTDIENLTLTGTAIAGIGNASDNTIIGNAQNNVINGDGGADLMIGGAGNDSYYVDNAGDRVSEGTESGTDWVYSSVSFTLWTDVENLTLTGTAAINGTGNAQNNAIAGNGASNTLEGGDGFDNLEGAGGNDTLRGGLGKDVLSGGAGNDTLAGGGGGDRLTGGADADVFDLDHWTDSQYLNVEGWDQITDFQSGLDVIDLSTIDANLVGGTANDAFIYMGYNMLVPTGSGPEFSTRVAGQLAIMGPEYTGASNTYAIVADVDGNGTVDLRIDVTSVLGLQSSDLLL